MRFHIISLPHTQTTKEYCWCAYTSKVLRFCNMMKSLGHDVTLYGGLQNEADVTEFVPIVSEEDYKRWFSHYNWETMVFNDWNTESACWKEMNAKAIEEIQKRAQPGDILGLISGICQEQIAKGLPHLRAVEWGVGYDGIILDGLHVFESNAWMHYVYGRRGLTDGKFFDAVIPNSFDDEDYIFNEKKQDYLLYLGRPIPRKGLEVVKQLAARGHKIIIAGQGDPQIPGAVHVGVVRGKYKAGLLANAKALLAPTFYIEPFGGVVVEALLSGTPVITTDFGAFTETVRDGIDGFRCHTIGEFENATEMVGELNPAEIRKNSEKYLTKNVRHRYDEYFERISLLDNQGWYS